MEIKTETKLIILVFLVMLMSLIGFWSLENAYDSAIENYQDKLEQQSEVIKSLEAKNTELEEKVTSIKDEKEFYNKLLKELIKEYQKAKDEQEPSRGSYSRKNLGEFTVTAYDLSIASCGKPIGHKEYGITATGYNLSELTREEAMVIAVDPKIIPLGSKVRITFTNDKYSKYSGVYYAKDTGGAIKGSKIDIFLGDYSNNKTAKEVRDFGKTEAVVEIINK